jgi:hypothetical protein
LREELTSVRAVRTGLAASALAAICTLWSSTSHAQDPAQPAPNAQAAPPPAPPPPAAPPSPGRYPAPLSQTTQESYVPQSVALSGPAEIEDWKPGDPIPPGYHPTQRLRKGFIIAGAVTFGVLYLWSALGAAVDHDSGEDNADALYVPGIGPFIQMTKTTSATGNFFNVVDGLGQSAGLAMLIYGLASPRDILVRNDLGMVIAPTPYVTSHGGGFGLVGTF